MIDQNKINTKIFVKEHANRNVFYDENIDQSQIEFVPWENPYTMVNYVFPDETNLSKAWNNIKRPFKICPINYQRLFEKSNLAEYNICVFDNNNKLIGMCVLLKNINNFYLEIICTKIKNGIGGYLMRLILNLVGIKKILLRAEVSIVPFYEKYGFIKIHQDGFYTTMTN